MDKSLLIECQTSKKNIINVVRKFNKVKWKNNISRVMLLNKYEKMVPFNLWFRHPKYKVVDHYENNQHIRIRYYNGTILTPLVSNKVDNLYQIRSFLPLMSLYQPFYPETFYSVWEFLQMNHLDLRAENFLCICREERLGIMEAIILYYQKYKIAYIDNLYHIWMAGNDKYDIYGDYFYSNKTVYPDYLSQIYHVSFIKSTKELIKYDFIFIDCINLFENFFEWKTENEDLYTSLFYMLLSLNYLKQNGSMMVRFNMIGSKSWSILFDIANLYFMEYTFYRPSTLNPCNSEIFLFLDKFHNNIGTNRTQNLFYMNLYKFGVYRIYYLNIIPNTNNPIYQKFMIQTKKWIDNLEDILKNPFKANKVGCISEWHKSNDLKQIKDLEKKFDIKSIVLPISRLKNQPTFKPVVPYFLYSQPIYIRLLEKKAELNYYKRVLDTKPSLIYTESRAPKKSSFLTWEQLTQNIDVYRNLKRILMSQYRAEMVTNAWIKMFEILNHFHDIIPQIGIVKTFHICEAPGAFISSINHFLSNRNQELDWYAQTLNPNINNHCSNIALGDHFGLMKMYPNRWIFGNPEIDISGDITCVNIIKHYASNPLLKNLDFITADAGIKCDPKDLNEQEMVLCKTNMGQIICILACLPIGKSAIFKTFIPLSEPLNISMIYLLTYLFTDVIFVKPSASHSSNSEIYVLLKGYKGISSNLLEILYTMLDSPKITSKSSLFSQYDPSFLESYISNLEFLIDRQILSLSKSYYCYYHSNEIKKISMNAKKYMKKWLKTNPISILERPLL